MLPNISTNIALPTCWPACWSGLLCAQTCWRRKKIKEKLWATFFKKLRNVGQQNRKNRLKWRKYLCDLRCVPTCWPTFNEWTLSHVGHYTKHTEPTCCFELLLEMLAYMLSDLRPPLSDEDEVGKNFLSVKYVGEK